MRKTYLMLIVLMITGTFIFSFTNVDAKIGDSSCNPIISLVNQDPINAVPGSYVKVVIEISNLYTCNGFAVKLDQNYPFSLDPGVSDVQTLASIPVAPNFKNTWTIPYTLRVADDALENSYNLNLEYHEGNDKDFSNTAFQSSFPISVSNVQTDFEIVVQGSSGSQISLGVVNTGKNTANSLIIGVPKQDSYTTSGTSQQIVGNLNAGDYTIVSFNINARTTRNMNNTRVPGDFASGNATSSGLKIQLDYTDTIGERRSIIKEIEYNPGITGNFSSMRFGTTSRSSSSWWPFILLVVVLAGVIGYARKNKIKSYFNKDKKEEPDWIEKERKKK